MTIMGRYLYSRIITPGRIHPGTSSANVVGGQVPYLKNEAYGLHFVLSKPKFPFKTPLCKISERNTKIQQTAKRIFFSL
jgi:hypothetical protein